MNTLKRLIENIKEKLTRIRKPLTAEKVGFSYTNNEVLRDVSLHLKEGEMVAIIGKSGSGKSTFLKLISGILSGSGRIRIFGKQRIFGKEDIGFVPQELSFIPDLSIEDNIKVSGLNLGISEEKALEQANVYMKLLKLEENIKKKPTELSGGQKVRINIVLSLLHEPKILILDEPFVGLDFQNRRLLWHFLESMKKKGKSIILTSHLLTETQEHVSRLVILKNGNVFFNGKIEQLKEKMRTNYIFEARFAFLSKENIEKIKKYCAFKDISILDLYERYMMFSIYNQKQKLFLEKLFEKLNLKHEEISFREPNLDEIFLCA
jgi:ABC-2 type transport system ATP-binding protein